MPGSGTVQLAVKVAHEYLNKHSLVVSAGPDGPRFRTHGVIIVVRADLSGTADASADV